MAAYFHPEIQSSGDHGGLHTLILMNPNLAAAASYTDSHHAPPPSSSHNILLLNSAAAAAAAASATTLSHPPPPLHHPHNPQFIRLPPQQDNITLYGYPPQEARDVTRRLHLSLSSENPPPYGIISPEHNREGEVSGVGQSSVLGSKYLKAAQELLEEVVHVGDGVIPKSSDESPRKASSEGDKLVGGGGGGGGGGAQLSTAERQEIQMKKAKLATMLDEAEQRYRQYHQQMQIVITSFEQAAGYGSAKAYTSLALKTISKQFRCLKDAIHGQIRAANKTLGEEDGGGGGGGGGGGVKIEGSRLKYIDHQIRQQKALQQLGMIQNHNAWRPQRGLPERSVSVLRAWLFEHFLHPYPKDSDKIMLAKQTGLTRSQVSNWFINARVRLWKPMIEEMYAEETKEQEQQQKTTEEKSSSNNNNNNSNNNQEAASNNSIDQNHQDDTQVINPSSSSSSPPLMNIPGNSAAPTPNSFQHSFALQMEAMSEQGSPKRQRNDEIFIKFGAEQKQSNENNNGYPIISGGMNFIGGGGDWFGTEDFQPPQPPPSRFLPSNLGNGNGISLSLGLPPFENSHHHHHHQHMDINTVLSPAAAAQNIHQFRSTASGHSSAATFECIDIQNRKGFAAQLLQDFVA